MKRLCSVNKAFASAQRGADTYYSDWLHVGSLHELLVLVDVTVLSAGSPTLAITLQTSPNASTAFDHTVFGGECEILIATGKYSEAVSNFGKFVRLKAVVAGTDTPKVTFEAFIVAKS